MIEFDPGPPAPVAEHLGVVPTIAPEQRRLFWYDWGPIFYRGRLDRSARVLCIASDPGPTERVAGRTLVGDAGQRVQGFLTKLGLDRSYVCVNAYPWALRPSMSFSARPVLEAQREWRNDFYRMIVGRDLQAIIAFGGQAQQAVDLWEDKPDVLLKEIPHPSNPTSSVLLPAWREAMIELRHVVTPDPGGDNTGPNYGDRFLESDYAPIPHRDLPFGVPPWFGDDAWGRQAKPRHNNSVKRDPADLLHTLIWQSPADQP